MSNKKFDFGKLIVAAAIIIVAVFLLMLGGCEQRKNVGADKYYFEQETFVRESLRTDIVLVASEDEMLKLAYAAGATVPTPRVIQAFSILNSDGSCRIYMLDPRVSNYAPEWIGHELTHCVFGEWHRIQP